MADDAGSEHKCEHNCGVFRAITKLNKIILYTLPFTTCADCKRKAPWPIRERQTAHLSYVDQLQHAFYSSRLSYPLNE